MEREYRGYVFVNRALSSIQKGLQGAHALVELCHNHEDDNVLYTWSTRDKTLIYLDCGFHKELVNYYHQFANLCDALNLPHASFFEDYDTMADMCTAFCGIIPDSVFNLDLEELELSEYQIGMIPDPDRASPTAKLAYFLRQFKLAT